MIAYIPWLSEWTYSLRHLNGTWVLRIWTRRDDARHIRTILKRELGYTGPYSCKPIHLERV